MRSKRKITSPLYDSADSEGHEYLTQSFGNARWSDDDRALCALCPMRKGQTMLQAAMAQNKANVVTCLQRLAALEPPSEPEPTSEPELTTDSDEPTTDSDLNSEV